jgi:hypothetical protein
MAERDRIREGQQVRLEDVVEVGSRVSWGAILAGAVMSLAICFLLSLLGAAIGLSATRNFTEGVGIGAAVWAVITTIIALFFGGWVTSQCVVGETKAESVVHSIIMWGVTLAMLLWLTASGISAGFNSMMQAANAVGGTSQENWQRMARAAGVSQADLDRWTNQAAAQAQDPDAQRQAQRTAMQAAWWTFGGTVLSLIAAIIGAVVGAGPTFRLLPIHVVTRRQESRPLPG